LLAHIPIADNKSAYNKLNSTLHFL